MIEGVRKGAIERKGAVGNADIEDGGRREAVVLQHPHRARPGRQARQLGKRRHDGAQPVLEMRGKAPACARRLTRIAVRHRNPSIGIGRGPGW